MRCTICNRAFDPAAYESQWNQENRFRFMAGYQFCQNPYHYPAALPPTEFEEERQGGEV